MRRTETIDSLMRFGTIVFSNEMMELIRFDKQDPTVLDCDAWLVMVPDIYKTLCISSLEDLAVWIIDRNADKRTLAEFREKLQSVILHKLLQREGTHE